MKTAKKSPGLSARTPMLSIYHVFTATHCHVSNLPYFLQVEQWNGTDAVFLYNP